MSKPILSIQKFWTEYKPDPRDAAKLIEIDMVAYGPLGQLDRSLTHAKISNLSKLLPLAGNEMNPAVSMAHARWDAIRPHYEAWKGGKEVPLHGTPLAAWNGVTPEQADVLRSRDIKTVEQVAELNDSLIARIPLPSLRDIIANAQRYVASADTVRFAKELEDKDRRISNQQTQLEEQREQITALLSKVDQLATMVAQQQERQVGAAVNAAAPAPAPKRARQASAAA